MPTVSFSGASDDLIEVEGCQGADEFNWLKPTPWSAELAAPDGSGLRVLADYGGRGTWGFGIAQLDEGVALPSWPISFAQADRDYSVLMTIEVPDGTVLRPEVES